jgi:hypothetical protein
MVKNHHLLTALALVVVLLTFVKPTMAWSGTYHLDREWVKIWINQDGTIDLFYNMTITLDSGDNINYVYVGQPNADFTIGSAIDQYGNSLTASDFSAGSEYRARANLHLPLTAGQTIWFTLMTNVGNMIYNDTTNVGNLGMQFIPCWWPVTVQDLRVSIVLPSGVTASMVKTYVHEWTSTSTESDGRLAVYWEKQNLSPNEQYAVGVSFPKEYLPDYQPPSSGTSNPSSGTIPSYWFQFILLFLMIGGAVVLIVIGVALSRKHYFAPLLRMETLGVKHGLTAVEASYLLDMKPTKIAAEILYSVLQKRAVWVEAAKPSIKLRIMQKFENPQDRKELLRYYETDFLDAVKPDGALEEGKLADAIMNIRYTVEDKMRGYCRRDTIAYYRSVVAKAWQQVEQAGTPELASNAYDEQLLWLLLDPDVRTRTQNVFSDRVFQPNPVWFWYWYGYQHYYPHATYKPNIDVPAQAAKPPAIPGADFANNIATSLEQTANNIVLNIERFANAVVPAPQQSRTSHEPVHHDASCVCACHACACACACVSCACACAGGGVG